MYIRKKKVRNCVDCGTQIVAVYFAKEIENTYCGSCAQKRRTDRLRGPLNPNWKGGKKIKKGYVYLKRPDHFKADSRGYVQRSHLIWEQMTGHYPIKGEIIHHKDGSTDNDDIENLQLMTIGEHVSLHHRGHKKPAIAGANNPAYKHGKYVGRWARLRDQSDKNTVQFGIEENDED